jgi:hypothetical protein
MAIRIWTDSNDRWEIKCKNQWRTVSEPVPGKGIQPREIAVPYDIRCTRIKLRPKVSDDKRFSLCEVEILEILEGEL